ncbi:MAG: hypothetical protein NWS86_06010 [Flavobacteriales bacterium]|nr:hypothetical protein [Flavobacteriales bacterium]
MKTKRIFLLAPAFLLLLIGCAKDEEELSTPPVNNEEELITTFILNLENIADATDTIQATFRDVDGPGGEDPVLESSLVLQRNATYNGVISVLDESGDETEDITIEVEEEGAEHLFCFDFEGVNGVSVAYADSDGIYGIGILSTWIGEELGQGTVSITLKHQPGVKDGTCEPGETDIEVSFPIEIIE